MGGGGGGGGGGRGVGVGGGGAGRGGGVRGRRGPKGIVHILCVRVKHASIK